MLQSRAHQMQILLRAFEVLCRCIACKLDHVFNCHGWLLEAMTASTEEEVFSG